MIKRINNLNLNYTDQLGSLSKPLFKTKFKINSIKNSVLKKLYIELIRIRIIELKIANLASEKKINTPVHLSVGQEAISVGVSHNLSKLDFCFGNHRSHSHILSRGTDLNKFISECFGKDSGLSRGLGGSMHLIDKSVGFGGSVPIVGATIPIACGYALSQKLQKTKNISVAFFGDGACEEGVFHETLNFSSVHNIPILFVVENNLFSSHLDINLRQTSNKISRFADTNKIKSETIDGNNILEVAKKSKLAIEYIKKKSKPFLLEMITYRHLGHVGPNQDIDVGVKRNKKELNNWIQNRDPVKNFEQFLINKKIIDFNFINKNKEKILIDVNKAIKLAIKSKFPNVNLMKRVLYNEK